MKRILIVEDDLFLRGFMTRLFRQWNYIVESASSCEDGARLSQRSTFSLYLIDVELPDGSGIDLCRRIHTLDTRTPVVVYSGSEDMESLAIQAGACAYVRKGDGLVFRLRQALTHVAEISNNA